MKLKLLFASPFPPMKSGISDYSACLVWLLDKYFDITLWTDNYLISDEKIRRHFKVVKGENFKDFGNFDYILYNMGNNCAFHAYIYKAMLEYPGCVILHDFSINHFFRGYYEGAGLWRRIYGLLGLDKFLSYKYMVKNNYSEYSIASLFPLNDEILKSDNKFLVHSDYSYKKIIDKKIVNTERIKKISHVPVVEDSKNALSFKDVQNKYKIPEDTILISSFGYIQANKLNREICLAVKNLIKKGFDNICYLMAGEGIYVDELLEYPHIIKTGYTELEEFNLIVDNSDIVVNLRYPTMGETSGVIIRSLQLGKTCITNNGGWFTEIPDDAVLKIDLNDIVPSIEEKLLCLIKNKGLRESLGKKAKAYFDENYNKEKIAEEIYDFIVKRE